MTKVWVAYITWNWRYGQGEGNEEIVFPTLQNAVSFCKFWSRDDEGATLECFSICEEYV